MYLSTVSTIACVWQSISTLITSPACSHDAPNCDSAHAAPPLKTATVSSHCCREATVISPWPSKGYRCRRRAWRVPKVVTLSVSGMRYTQNVSPFTSPTVRLHPSRAMYPWVRPCTAAVSMS